MMKCEYETEMYLWCTNIISFLAMVLAWHHQYYFYHYPHDMKQYVFLYSYANDGYVVLFFLFL